MAVAVAWLESSAARVKGGSRAGVLAAGWCVGGCVGGTVAERALSLLRDRLDEAGETGMDEGADMLTPETATATATATAGPVLRDAPLSFALRLSARSFCSVNDRPSVSAGVRGGEGWKSGGRRCWCRYICVYVSMWLCLW